MQITKKNLIVITLIIFTAITSISQSNSSEQVYAANGHLATIICTEHRNELAARGLGPIFMHKNKYCVAFADSSQQILGDFADWIYNGLFEVFTGTVANNSAINHNKDKQNTVFLDEFIDWVTGENFSGDTDRYPGQGKDQYASSESKSTAKSTTKDSSEEQEGMQIPIAQ